MFAMGIAPGRVKNAIQSSRLEQVMDRAIPVVIFSFARGLIPFKIIFNTVRSKHLRVDEFVKFEMSEISMFLCEAWEKRKQVTFFGKNVQVLFFN